MIETRRLELRPLMASDHAAFNELFSDQEVMKSSLNGTKSSEEVLVWLANQIRGNSTSNFNLLAIIKKPTTSVIGYCGLTPLPNTDGASELEIGYRIIRKYWGHGYATEAASAIRDYAFNKLGITRIIALIEPVNISSISVATKIGMSYEKDVMLDGYDHPDHLYAINNETNS